MTNSKEATSRVIRAIQMYESDTFSADATNVSHQEATVMASAMVELLGRCIEEGRQFPNIDGATLSMFLEGVREPNSPML